MAADAPRLNFVSARDLSRRTFAPTEFIVPGLVPKGLSLLGGRPKIGKSWLALNMAVAVASGGTFLGRVAAPGRALYLALEDSPSRLKRRLDLVLDGREPPVNLDFAVTCPALGGINGGAVAAIRHWQGAGERPALVIVDVAQRIRPATGKGERLYEADYNALIPLKTMADEDGIALVAVCHTRKSAAEDGGDPLDAISGTLGLVGAADHALILDRNSTGYTLYGRGRDVEEFNIALSFDASRGTWRALGDAADVSRSETRLLILSVLRGAPGPLSPASIAKASRLNGEVVRKQMERMVAAGEVVKLQRGVYTVPDAAPLSDPLSTPHHNDHNHHNRIDESDGRDGCDGGVRKARGRHAPRAAHLNGNALPDHEGIAVPRAPPS